jgi:hypothetical protein
MEVLEAFRQRGGPVTFVMIRDVVVEVCKQRGILGCPHHQTCYSRFFQANRELAERYGL